jgi:hypothetical protein
MQFMSVNRNGSWVAPYSGINWLFYVSARRYLLLASPARDMTSRCSRKDDDPLGYPKAAEQLHETAS